MLVRGIVRGLASPPSPSYGDPIQKLNGWEQGCYRFSISAQARNNTNGCWREQLSCQVGLREEDGGGVRSPTPATTPSGVEFGCHTEKLRAQRDTVATDATQGARMPFKTAQDTTSERFIRVPEHRETLYSASTAVHRGPTQ